MTQYPTSRERSNSRDASVLLPRNYAPSNNDILCGRGKLYSKHPGNSKFSSVIRGSLQRYVDAPKRVDKSIVVASILIGLQEMGHRFVKHDKSTNQWFMLGDEPSHEKTGHAIRDLLKSIRSQKEGKKTRTNIVEANDNTRNNKAKRVMVVKTKTTTKKIKNKKRRAGTRKNYPPPPAVTSTTEDDVFSLFSSNKTTKPRDPDLATNSLSVSYYQQRRSFRTFYERTNEEEAKQFAQELLTAERNFEPIEGDNILSAVLDISEQFNGDLLIYTTNNSSEEMVLSPIAPLASTAPFVTPQLLFDCFGDEEEDHYDHENECWGDEEQVESEEQTILNQSLAPLPLETSSGAHEPLFEKCDVDMVLDLLGS
jgi:hypothetical protein